MKLIPVRTATVVLGILLSGVATSSRAAVLTLDDCIETALKNRTSIIAARGAERLAKADQTWALGAFLPTVSASYAYSRTKTTHIESSTGSEPDQDGTSKGAELRASMSLFDLSNFFNYAGAHADRLRAHLDVIESEQNLILSVKVSYYAYLAAVENVAVQEQAVKRSEEQLKLIQSKFDLGSAALSDVLKQKVQFGKDKLALLTAQNVAISSKGSLAYTIGIDPNSDVEYSTEVRIREYEGGLDAAMKFAWEREPSILAAQKGVTSSKHAVSSRLSEYLPKLSGSFSLSTSDGTRGDTATYDFSSRDRTYGFQVSWNIFDGFSRERAVTAAKINRNNALAEMAETRNAVARDVRTTYQEIAQYKEAKVVASENVQAAEEDLKITQEKYNLGAATILDLLDAQHSLKGAQVALIEAGFDLNLAVARLENAMGQM
jgi:outer membrane protein